MICTQMYCRLHNAVFLCMCVFCPVKSDMEQVWRLLRILGYELISYVSNYLLDSTRACERGCETGTAVF